ncbi:hypothetical protein DSCW_23410 [Desulfosarcina widdelii]|uniref:Uncharacterized protein n=1 Tax=Desulfosarcina widdelii TaxID=947919 RepID=A0A5K7Z8Y8_9BACT|nr:hypothetical protein DSCW_23410 [Desulfosarcina widdelii]
MVRKILPRILPLYFFCDSALKITIYGSTLINAAYYNFYDVAKILIRYNADKTIKDMHGNTAYDYASQYEYTRIMNLLKDE